MHAANKTALYAPLWVILTIVPYALGFGNFILTLFSFKLFIIFFYIITIIIMQRLTQERRAIIFFALNPLVVFETLVSAHNDIVMIFFVLVAYYFILKKKIVLGSLYLFFSILIKYATFILLPVFVYIFVVIGKKKMLDVQRIFFSSFLLMFVIFLLSFLREEIYPWYAIWFLCFASLLKRNFILHSMLIIFSVSLLFRYLPYMLLLTHFGITPALKTVVTFAPSIFLFPFIFYAYKRKG
jgi:hypothetical protein